jgi:two-component system OmpR family sensor kinase
VTVGPVAATFSRRLFVRFYLYQAVVILTFGLAAFLLWGVFLAPARERSRDAVAWASEFAVGEMDEPARLQRALDGMQRRFEIRVTVYAADGHVVAHTGNVLPPVDPPTVARLLRGETVDHLPDDAVAVGRRAADGRLLGYGITSTRISDTSNAERYLRVLVVLLLAIALGNVPLVRSIAVPISTLSRAAKAFGDGDMRARANLRRRDEIGDLARAFDEMADAVEASRRAEKELLANVSHELRTPLARIRVVHELAAEKFPDVAQRYMKEIAVDLGELERLIDDIIRTTRLDLTDARGGNPSNVLHLEQVPLGEFVEGLVGRFSALHEDRPVELDVDYELSVSADPVMLKRAISNVLENAHAYSLPGMPVSISVAGDGEAKNVEIRISDKGPGIDAADLPHVLTPFFRADRSRSRNTGGIGLGLSLTRRILEAHRGAIRVRSTPGEGTTVTLTLPLA